MYLALALHYNWSAARPYLVPQGSDNEDPPAACSLPCAAREHARR